MRMEQQTFAEVTEEAKVVEVENYERTQEDFLDTFKCMPAPEMLLMLAVFGIKLRTADIVKAIGKREKWMKDVKVFSSNCDDYKAYLYGGKPFWLTSEDTIVYINGKCAHKGKMTQMVAKEPKAAAQ